VKIRFIGTGSGKTSLKRHHSSFIITSGSNNLLVDCGDGTSLALLKQNVNPNSIDSILISHLHADHYAGIASLITQMKLLGRKNPLSLFIHSSIDDYIKSYLENSYLFLEKLDFDLNVIQVGEEEKIFINDSLSFVAKLNSHLDKYKNYDISKNLSYASLSFLFNDDESSVIYTGDIGSRNDLYLFNEKVEWFIVEISHINLTDLITRNSKNTSKQIILTHIDDDSENEVEKFLKSAQNDKNFNIIAAYDGLIIKHI
jgi:ribonuclease BN (tRNA processing enzyme)